MEVAARDDARGPDAASPAFRAAAAAAAFGMALRDDPFRGAADYDLAIRLSEHGPAPVAADPASRVPRRGPAPKALPRPPPVRKLRSSKLSAMNTWTV